MKTIIEKLTDKLCECEAVREDIMELKIGALLLWFGEQLFYIEEGEPNISGGTSNYRVLRGSHTQTVSKHEIDIIGNPLELRHLMMYCEEKGLGNLIVSTNGNLSTYKVKNRPSNIDINSLNIKLDNTLPFHEQPEETLKLILDFLNR